MIDIVVNGDPHRVASGSTVATLVATLEAGPRGVAVAIDEEVVPRSVWASTELRDGHRIEVLRASQGG
jgi:sulfur carrier protein